MLNSQNETYYSFFLNNYQANISIGGFFGFGIGQLNSDELEIHCKNISKNRGLFLNLSSQIKPPSITNSNFTTGFSIRVFSSGCYYYDLSSGYWSSDGLEVQSDTILEATHCTSTHLTDFAGGFIVLPPQINFSYVWANASFNQNFTINLVLICLSAFYIVLSLVAYRYDKIDKQNMKITLLSENMLSNSYFYEIIVITGSHFEAGTNSKVI